MNVSPFWTQILPHRMAITILVSAVLNGVVLLTQWYIVSPYGAGGMGWMFAEQMLLGLCTIVVLVGMVFSAVLILLRATRDLAATYLGCGLVFLMTGLCLLPQVAGVRHHGFERIAIENRPVVQAIHQYVTDHGQPPKNLNELVPAYLETFPSTGMPAYPHFRYSTQSDKWEGNPWVLWIDCSVMFLNWDKFLYFPLQNYPDHGYGGRIERIGEWGYVHE